MAKSESEQGHFPWVVDHSYYAVKKVFVKFFAKFFEVFAKFFKVFASFLRFSRAFRGFRIHSDPLGCIRMHSEAIGSVWTFSKIFEIFWIFESFFLTFPDVIFTKDFFHGTIGPRPGQFAWANVCNLKKKECKMYKENDVKTT